jgi:predicted DNA binding CopG/RHH family protein
MTKDDTQNNRKSFTLRLNAELSKKVEKEAGSLGLTQNSYITMILHKALRKEIEGKGVC